MNTTLIVGMIIVTGALIAYSMAVLTQQRKQVLTQRFMTFLTMGVTLDIIATACMIAGSRNVPFTAHGILGYSALAGMLLDTTLTWRHWKSEKKRELVSKGLVLYTWIAYLWWVLAYIAGGLIASLSLALR